MLKKFLKFLRGGAENSEQFEGSYLDDLLERVRPRIEAELERCPEHDPMPLLVAEILREVDEETFGQELNGPVVDSESPPLSPPPPPEGDEREGEPTPPPAPEEPPEVGEGSEEDDEENGGEESSVEDDDTDEPVEPDGEQTDAEETDDTDETVEAETEESEKEATEGDAEGGDGRAGEEADEEEAETTESEESDPDTEPDAEEDTEEAAETAEEAGERGTASDEPGDEEPVAGAEPPEASESTPPDEFQTESYEVETSVDAESDRAAEAAHLEGPEAAESGAPRVDSEIVLEMGRVFLGMLVENDALPVDLQMSVDEIGEARELLSGYFLGGDRVEQRAREMLRMVEEKFDEGLFSQARILLQLFDADQQTRIENDRNLFYDEMILRFGIQRRHPVGGDIEEKLDERLDQFAGGPEEFEDLLVWLSETIYVTFNVYGRNREAFEKWREIAEESSRPNAPERLLEVIPPTRWRLLDEYSRSGAEIIDERMTPEYVEEYVNDHVKTCYFVLRAVGDTGLEPYLDDFFDWVEVTFDVDGPALMPGIYTETTENERLIDDIFHELYEEHFEADAEAMREGWTRAEVEEALEEVVDDIGSADLTEIPPGHYDLGRFVLDKLFEVEYTDAEFPFKMHRLT